MKKRTLSFLLALLMVVSIFPAPTYATDSTDVTITPTETPTEVATETPCPTCGTVGCTSEHLTWCADCKKDDCGQNHCDSCGAIDCTTEHKTCDKCGTLDCTADHTNWCADCKVDDCGVDHNATEPTEAPANEIAVIDDGENTSPYHANIGRKAQFDLTYSPFPIVSDPAGITSGDVFGMDIAVSKDVIPADMIVKIADCYVNEAEDIYWYKIEAAEGYSLPAEFPAPAWVFQDNVSYSGGASLILLDEEPENTCGCCDSCTGAEGCECVCGECDFCEKEEEPEVPSISATVNGQTITVSGNLPEGTSLDISATAKESGVVNVVDFDINLSMDSVAYEPETDVTVTISGLNVAPGRFVKVTHYLEDINAIQNGYNAGTIQVWEDAEIASTYPAAAAAAYTALGMENTVCVEQFYSTENEVTVSDRSITFTATSFSIYTVTYTGTAAGRTYSVYNDDGGAMNSNGYNAQHEITMDDSDGETFMLTRGQKFYVDIGPHFYKFGMARYVFTISSSALGSFENGKTEESNGLGDGDVVLTIKDNAPFYTHYTLKLWNNMDSRTINIYVVPEVQLSFNSNIPSGATANNVTVPSSITTVLGDGSTNVRYTRVPVTNPTGSVTGYTFDGWYTAATGGEKVSADGYVFLDNDNATYVGGTFSDQYSEVLYAHWNPITYKVTLNNQSATTAGTTNYWYKYNTVDNGVYYYTNSDCSTALANSTITKPTKTGYTFKGYYTGTDGSGTQYVNENGLCVNNLYKARAADTTLYAYWTANTSTKYTVETYTQNLADDNYTKTSETKTGTTGADASVTPSAPTGFTYNASKSTTSGTIAADGSLVLKVYYDRNSYTVTTNKGTGISAVSGAGTYKYGASVSINATVSDGYKWKNWTDYNTKTAQNYTFTMPASNVTYTASAEKISYTVTFDMQGATSSIANKTLTWNEQYALPTPEKKYTVTYDHNYAVSGTQVKTSDTAQATFLGWADEGSIVYNGTTWAYTDFDAPFYGKNSPDVVASSAFGNGIFNKYALLDHFVRHGQGEYANGSISRKPAPTGDEAPGRYTGGAVVSNLSTTDGALVPLIAGWSDVSSVILPTPTRAGHTFAGWYSDSGLTTKVGDAGDSYNPTANVTLYAKWTANSCTVTFVDEDGTTILKEATEYEYGTAAGDIEKPIDPTKAATAEYTYTFAGWFPTISDVTENMTYKATYTATKNKHTITWLNDDGTVIDTTSVAYGDVPTHADPTKAATAEYIYTFAGWTPEVVKVTGEATYKATYTAEKVKYTVTFVDEDGTTILKEAIEYEYGTAAENIVKPADPAKEATAEYTYTFAGWTPEIAEVTANVTYKATYTEVKNQYTLSGEIDHGTVTDSVTVNYGTQAKITFTPAVGYKFHSWKVNDGAATLITTPAATLSYEDLQLMENKHVVVTMAPIEYTITYYLRDGNLGEGITNPGTYTVETDSFTLNKPTRAGYKFKGWATSADATTGAETVTITKGTTGNLTFYAVWERSLVDLTITTTCADQEQSFIFTVSGTPTDPSYGTVTLDVVLVGNDSITIKDLPVGTYTVTEKDGWSWRENSVESKTADLRTTSQIVSFDFGIVDDLHWLSGYSYKRKKGGS